MFSMRFDDLIVSRWRQPNVAQALDFVDANGEGSDAETATPLWKDLTVASALALALWAVAAVLFLG